MSAPQRIQLRRTKGWRMPPGAVKVDRSTRFGNPWVVARCGCHPDGAPAWTARHADEIDPPLFRSSLAATVHAVRQFRSALILTAPDLSALRGIDLACWCKPGAPCHADVLLEIANRPDEASR